MDSYKSRFFMKLLASMMPFRQVYVNMCTFPYQYVYVYMYIQIYTYLEICIYHYHIYIYTTVYTFILGVYKQITSPYLQFGRYQPCGSPSRMAPLSQPCDANFSSRSVVAFWAWRMRGAVDKSESSPS